jgi:Arc/MetJ-type ribon-helix-helix transcriptional regulator
MTIDLSNLPEPLLKFLRTQVAEGKFQSEEEFITALLQREAEATTDPGKVWRERELAFQKEMVAAGILAEAKLPTPRPDQEPFQPIEIDGPPLSETVIQDRR